MSYSTAFSQSTSPAIDPGKFTFVRLKWTQTPRMSQHEKEIHHWNVDGRNAEDGPQKGLSAEQCLLSTIEKATDGLVRVNKTPLSLTIKEFTSPKNTFPFAFMTEVGWLEFQQEEISPFKNWLDKGGFLMVDDFHGPMYVGAPKNGESTYHNEWRHWTGQLKRLYPDLDIDQKPLPYTPVAFYSAQKRPRGKRGPPILMELTKEHPVFHSLFSFKDIPHVYGLNALEDAKHMEYGGERHTVVGLFSPEGRLMILMNYNMDVGDGLERCGEVDVSKVAEKNLYNLLLVPDGLRLGMNYIIYALTH
ncbi:MAG: DUF4159 domain-containing protein [Bdellovibrionales bacterium]